jgi:hypothetical protein
MVEASMQSLIVQKIECLYFPSYKLSVPTHETVESIAKEIIVLTPRTRETNALG